MKIELDIPDRALSGGLRLEWDHGFEIATRVDDGETVISANAAGLRSLARILLSLAASDAPPGSHVHLDTSNSLEDGSVPLILERL